MFYMEYLRVRWRPVIFLTINVVLAALVVLSVGHAHLQVNGQEEQVHDIPLSVLFRGAGIAALCMAAFMPTLNTLDASLTSVWTRPVSRERTAVQMMLCDVLAIIAVWTITAAVWFAAIVVLGLFGHLVVDAQAPTAALLFLGTALMAYGNVQAASAWNHARGGAIAGALFGGYFFLLLVSAAPVGDWLHAISSTLNHVNPFAYFLEYSLGNGGSGEGAPTLSPLADTIFTYVIGLCGLTLAAFSWKRMEL